MPNSSNANTAKKPVAVLPFGKCKGQPINGLDTSYLCWVYSQGWFRSTYPELRGVVRKRIIMRLTDELPAPVNYGPDRFRPISAAEFVRNSKAPKPKA